MRKNAHLIYSLGLMAGDFIALIAGFVVAYIARVSIDHRPLIEQIPAREYIKIFALLIPFWLLIFAGLGLYSKYVYSNRWRELWRLALGSFVGMLFIIGYDFVNDPNSTIFPARLVAAYAFLLGFTLLALERQVLWQIKKWLYRYGRGIERVMLIGSSQQTREVASLLGDSASSGYHVSAIVGQQSALPQKFRGRHFSALNEALVNLRRLKIDTIIQTKLYESSQSNRRIQSAALKNHIDYKLMLTEHDYFSGRSAVELFQYFPVIHISPTPLLGWGRVVKRGVDLSLGLVGLVVLSPILLLIALLILLFDFGPVWFKQKRLTRWSKEATVVKFRTMKAKYSGRDPAEVFNQLGRPELIQEYQSNRAKVADDPRVSSLGRFLRASSLDELPQLINVIKGDISLVGPRTIPKDEAEQDLREKSPLILSVKTGITGLAQVSGRSDLTIEERIRLDQYYVQNWSLWLDFKIILKTIGV
ncbi:MAG TPA: exopolysaccharide biosynthesis polyprenyl glycosylphosphotransferase, partial [Candidatus Saccharimonadales bacterium]